MNTIDRYLAENSNDIGLMKKILIQDCEKYELVHSKVQKKVRNLNELKNYFLKSVQPVITTNRNMYFNFLMLVLNKIEDFELTPEEKLLLHKFAKYVAFTTFISLPDKKHIEQIHQQTGFDCISFFDELGICYRYKVMGVPGFHDVGFDFNKVNYFDYNNGKIIKEFDKLSKRMYPEDGYFNFFENENPEDLYIKSRCNHLVAFFSNILQKCANKKYHSGSLTKSQYNQVIKDIKKNAKRLDVNAIFDLLLLEIAKDQSIIDEMNIHYIELLLSVIKPKASFLNVKYKNIQFAVDYFEISKYIMPNRIDTKYMLETASFIYANSNFRIIGAKKDLEKANSKSDILNVITKFIEKLEDFNIFEDAIVEIKRYKKIEEKK